MNTANPLVSKGLHIAVVPSLLINLGAWNDHPLVVQAIKERIDAHWPAPRAGLP